MLDGEFAIALLDFRRRRAVISTAPWLRGPLSMWYFESSKSTVFEGQHHLKRFVKRGKVNVELKIKSFRVTSPQFCVGKVRQKQ